MKGIVITSAGDVTVRSFGEPLYKTVGAAVGGHIEIVYPRYLPAPYVMIVNEEGLLEGLPQNAFGCSVYGTREHGHPIVGNVVLMKEGVNEDGELNILGLEPEEIYLLRLKIALYFQRRREAAECITSS